MLDLEGKADAAAARPARNTRRVIGKIISLAVGDVGNDRGKLLAHYAYTGPIYATRLTLPVARS